MHKTQEALDDVSSVLLDELKLVAMSRALILSLSTLLAFGMAYDCTLNGGVNCSDINCDSACAAAGSTLDSEYCRPHQGKTDIVCSCTDGSEVGSAACKATYQERCKVVTPCPGPSCDAGGQCASCGTCMATCGGGESCPKHGNITIK